MAGNFYVARCKLPSWHFEYKSHTGDTWDLEKDFVEYDKIALSDPIDQPGQVYDYYDMSGFMRSGARPETTWYLSNTIAKSSDDIDNDYCIALSSLNDGNGFYSVRDASGIGVLSGTYPTFANLLASYVADANDIIVSRSINYADPSQSYIRIGSARFYASEFPNGVLPSRMLMVAQGAGGGGGGPLASDDGTGGGSGGAACIMLDFSKYNGFHIKGGVGGQGRQSGDGSTGDGNKGSDLIIYSDKASKPDIKLPGGGAGHASSSNNAGGASAGSPSTLSKPGLTMRNSIYGCTGGKRTMNGSASPTIYATASRASASTLDYDWKLTLGGFTGGKCIDYAGGGGASYFGPGGDGGKNGSVEGKIGVMGSGGGGGRYLLFQYTPGGAGGDGFIDFYY